jgi:hypothetical protein
MRSAFSETPSPPDAGSELIAMNDNRLQVDEPELEPELYKRPMSLVYAFGAFLTFIGLFLLLQ